MTGDLYTRNKLFDSVCLSGVVNLSDFESAVYAAETMEISMFDDYDTAIEEGWAEFIIDFCE
ncbi:MAG: hypothetical protein LBR38_01310 [Synergistaceae bacterium]|jgi:hypothetical protein|nr:hypothetical protein [Synergistaceae bacterium]